MAKGQMRSNREQKSPSKTKINLPCQQFLLAADKAAHPCLKNRAIEYV